MLYLDLEDLKESKSEGERDQTKKKEQKRESPTPFIKSLLGASVPPRAKSNFWPTMPSREQRGYQKSDPGGDHYYVGCLGQKGKRKWV